MGNDKRVDAGEKVLMIKGEFMTIEDVDRRGEEIYRQIRIGKSGGK